MPLNKEIEKQIAENNQKISALLVYWHIDF